MIIGAAVIVMILAAGRGVPAVIRWQRTSIEASQVELRERRRDADLARRLPVLRERWRRAGDLTARLDSAEIIAMTSVAAGARLMNVINELAQGAGVEVNSASLVGRDRERGSASHAVVSVQLTGGLEDVIVFLSTLEAGPPVAAVTDFSIAPASGPTLGSDAGKLQLALTIEAPVRRSAP